MGGVSWNAGYGPEIAVLRGLLAFMAVSLIGYVGELIVATAPPARAAPQAGSAEAADAFPPIATADEAGAEAGAAAVAEGGLEPPDIGAEPAVGGGAPVRALTPPPAEEEQRAA